MTTTFSARGFLRADHVETTVGNGRMLLRRPTVADFIEVAALADSGASPEQMKADLISRHLLTAMGDRCTLSAEEYGDCDGLITLDLLKQIDALYEEGKA